MLPPALEVLDLKKHFVTRKTLLGKPDRVVRAVDGVSFHVARGQTLGVVGESGCGKSTTARLLMHLIEPDAGRIRLHGREYGNVGGLKPVSELRQRMQMVFQDSYASLNPRLTIEDSIAFGPRIQGQSRSESRQLARDLLDQVGLNPDSFIRRYPHELSGGQRQRVNIARALAMKPEIMVLDEAVSALDKSVQAQVLNLLSDLKRDFELTYLFISHDLNVVQYISDHVVVMYLGQVVEFGPVAQIYEQPAHPYTRALLDAVPAQTPNSRKAHTVLEGDPPNPIDPPAGCRFHPRCPFAEPICAEREPVPVRVRPEQESACHMVAPQSGHSRHLTMIPLTSTLPEEAVA
ncbi:ABC transporter ATP-binding protein [Natronospirillum operosum]|uniref:Glutathione import ATP-binding protein GsiA n=1 Tax=Natronospirillum operosum TaxID=2759953 RepID=A0A4Z0WDS3_9GAMM|nr:ABC transporter ATP-binding protein [Natronospirillum operosum]TGG92078.1 ABC transporter ATP-binding protein [Natronospirillum operosum]